MAWDEGARSIASSDDIITVVLTADNHLGCRGPTYGAPFAEHPRKREERLRRLRSAFQQATDFAVGQGVDLFFQAGDLFDTPSPSEEDRDFVAARLAELRQAGVRTFAVSGWHDTSADGGCSSEDLSSMARMDAGSRLIEPRALFTGLAPQVSYARLGALHYFPPVCLSGHSGSVELEPVMLDVHGVMVAVCGLCSPPIYRGRGAGQEGDPLARVRVPGEVERAAVSLLLLHAPIELQSPQVGQETRWSAAVPLEHKDTSDIRKGQVGMHREDDGRLPVIAHSTIASQSSFRVILAGYHHSYRHLRMEGTNVIVAGATVGGRLVESLDVDDAEYEPGFVFLGVAADGIRWCHHVAGETLHVRRLVINMAELWEDAMGDSGTAGRAPTDSILERLGPLCTAESMVQLRLVGELNREQYHQVDFGRIRRYGEEHCFELAIDESGLSIVPREASLMMAPSSNGWSLAVPDASDQMEERLSPRKELVNLADEWIEAASDEQEKKALLATKEELLTALDRMRTRRL